MVDVRDGVEVNQQGNALSARPLSRRQNNRSPATLPYSLRRSSSAVLRPISFDDPLHSISQTMMGSHLKSGNSSPVSAKSDQHGQVIAPSLLPSHSLRQSSDKIKETLQRLRELSPVASSVQNTELSTSATGIHVFRWGSQEPRNVQMYRFFSSFKCISPNYSQKLEKNNAIDVPPISPDLNNLEKRQVQVYVDKLMSELESPSLGSRLRLYQRLYSLICEDGRKTILLATSTFEALCKRFMKIKRSPSTSHSVLKSMLQRWSLPFIRQIHRESTV